MGRETVPSFPMKEKIRDILIMVTAVILLILLWLFHKDAFCEF